MTLFGRLKYIRHLEYRYYFFLPIVKLRFISGFLFVEIITVLRFEVDTLLQFGDLVQTKGCHTIYRLLTQKQKVGSFHYLCKYLCCIYKYLIIVDLVLQYANRMIFWLGSTRYEYNYSWMVQGNLGSNALSGQRNTLIQPGFGNTSSIFMYTCTYMPDYELLCIC